jgi:hypothetical protein
MIGNDFVKEMQEALLTQQEHDDPASRASPNVSRFCKRRLTRIGMPL